MCSLHCLTWRDPSTHTFISAPVLCPNGWSHTLMKETWAVWLQWRSSEGDEQMGRALPETGWWNGLSLAVLSVSNSYFVWLSFQLWSAQRHFYWHLKQEKDLWREQGRRVPSFDALDCTPKNMGIQAHIFIWHPGAHNTTANTSRDNDVGSITHFKWVNKKIHCFHADG